MNDRHYFESIIPSLMNVNEFKLLRNFVLVEFDPKQNEKTSSGLWAPVGSLNHDTVADYVPRIGKVVKLPSELYYNKKDMAHSLRWKTEIELEIGDIIWMNHTTINDFEFAWEGKSYKLISYEDIVLAKRDDKTIMVNGYVLCKPIYSEVKILLFSKKEKIIKTVEVEILGKSNLEYQNDKWSDLNDINIGDVFFLMTEDQNKLRFLESDLFLKYDGKPHIVAQRYMLSALVTN